MAQRGPADAFKKAHFDTEIGWSLQSR